MLRQLLASVLLGLGMIAPTAAAPITYEFFTDSIADQTGNTRISGFITVEGENGSTAAGGAVLGFEADLTTRVFAQVPGGPLMEDDYSYSFGLEDVTSAEWLGFGTQFPFLRFETEKRVESVVRGFPSIERLTLSYDGFDRFRRGVPECFHLINAEALNEDPPCGPLNVGFRALFQNLQYTLVPPVVGEVPLPASMVLMLTGLFGFRFARGFFGTSG